MYVSAHMHVYEYILSNCHFVLDFDDTSFTPALRATIVVQFKALFHTTVLLLHLQAQIHNSNKRARGFRVSQMRILYAMRKYEFRTSNSFCFNIYFFNILLTLFS